MSDTNLIGPDVLLGPPPTKTVVWVVDNWPTFGRFMSENFGHLTMEYDGRKGEIATAAVRFCVVQGANRLRGLLRNAHIVLSPRSGMIGSTQCADLVAQYESCRKFDFERDMADYISSTFLL